MDKAILCTVNGYTIYWIVEFLEGAMMAICYYYIFRRKAFDKIMKLLNIKLE